jgi:AraC-like DNA-binding protein
MCISLTKRPSSDASYHPEGGGSQKAKKPASPTRNQPSSQDIWGFELPLVLPQGTWQHAQRCLYRCNATWWREGFGHAQADAELALFLAQLAEICTKGHRPDQSITSNMQHNWLKICKDVAQDSLRSGINVAGWAERLQMSRQHFTRKFRQESGQTPTEWLAHARLKLALEELTTSEKTIAEIARRTGFQSPAVFSRFCERHTGMLPSALRENSDPPAHDAQDEKQSNAIRLTSLKSDASQ